RYHGVMTVFASAWGGGIYFLSPEYFWWLAPIIGALILSVPLSVLVSRVTIGQRARRARLFATPEEVAPPREILELEACLATVRQKEHDLAPEERDGFVRVIVDPYVNALHCWLLRGPRSLKPSIRERRRGLVERALLAGPDALTPKER